MANYPTSLPSATPADHAEVLGEVVAIATELGTDPSSSFATVKARIAAVEAGIPVTQQTTDYTLALADAGTVVEVNAATAKTVTVPPQTSVAWPTGTLITIRQVGAGPVSLAAGAGVTVQNLAGLSEAWTELSLHRRSVDEWVVLAPPAASGGGGHSGVPAYVTGRYYDNRLTHANGTGQSTAMDIIRVVPWFVAQTTTFDRIGVNVTTAGDAGSVCRLGIYSLTNGVPNALVLDAGTVAIDTTGAKEITISQTLSAGWYGMALLHNSTTTPSFTAASPNDGAAPSLGLTSIATGANHSAWYVAQAYGALPNPLPAVSYLTINPWLVFLRAA